MEAVMRRRRRACFSARRRRPEEAPRTGGRGRACRAPAQKQRADKPHLSGQPGGAWRCSKHKTFTPSFVLFADNGIGHPCHSFGYAFGLPALFSTKITANYPKFYACCNAVRNGRCESATPLEAAAVAPPRRRRRRRIAEGKSRGHSPAGGAPNVGGRAP